MNWSRAAGVCAVLAVLGVVIGAGLSLATNGLFSGSKATAAIVVLILLTLVVGGMIVIGRGSARHTANPDAYW